MVSARLAATSTTEILSVKTAVPQVATWGWKHPQRVLRYVKISTFKAEINMFMVQELLPLYDICKEGVFFVFLNMNKIPPEKLGHWWIANYKKPHMLFTIKHCVYKRSHSLFNFDWKVWESTAAFLHRVHMWGWNSPLTVWKDAASEG